MKVVGFTLFGRTFMAMSAGPTGPFNHAISFVVDCDDQAELHRYWSALLDVGRFTAAISSIRTRSGAAA